MTLLPIWLIWIVYYLASTSQSRYVKRTPNKESPPPGANPETMGGTSAQAMSIGTGGSQQDTYSSSYKTPNYTQYTNSDYKGEFQSTLLVTISDLTIVYTFM